MREARAAGTVHVSRVADFRDRRSNSVALIDLQQGRSMIPPPSVRSAIS